MRIKKNDNTFAVMVYFNLSISVCSKWSFRLLNQVQVSKHDMACGLLAVCVKTIFHKTVINIS